MNYLFMIINQKNLSRFWISVEVIFELEHTGHISPETGLLQTGKLRLHYINKQKKTRNECKKYDF